MKYTQQVEGNVMISRHEIVKKDGLIVFARRWREVKEFTLHGCHRRTMGLEAVVTATTVTMLLARVACHA